VFKAQNQRYRYSNHKSDCINFITGCNVKLTMYMGALRGNEETY